MFGELLFHIVLIEISVITTHASNITEHYSHETIRGGGGGSDRSDLNLTDREIVEGLLRNYRFPDPSANISVTVHVSIDRIVNSFEHECHFWITIRQKWIEKRLAFEKQRPNGSKIRLRSGSYVWNPSIIVANALEMRMIGKETVELSSNGIVELSQKWSVKTNEVHSLRDFPLDKRNCTVQLFSEDSRAQWSDVTSISSSKTGWGAWELLDWTRHDRSIVLNLRRWITVWIWTLYAPTIALLICSWIALWIDGKSPVSRLLVEVTIFFTMLTIVLVNSWTVPRTAYMKALDLWNYQVVAFAFATVLHAAAVTRDDGAREKRKCKKNANTSFGDDLEKTQWLSNETPYYAHLNDRRSAATATVGCLLDCALRLLLMPTLLATACIFYSIHYVVPYIKY